jgi:YD repeat-containing protein
MKMKIIFISLLLTGFIACKKEKANDDCPITRLIINGGAKTYEFTYGSNRKIGTMLLLPDNELSTYQYEGNKTTITVTKNGSFRNRLIVTNNNNGLASNILLEQNESGSDWFNQAISYEGKNIVRNKVTDVGSGADSAIINYIWEAGNPTVVLSDGDIFHYDYHKEKPWQLGDWRNIQQMIGGYNIYEYRNLLKSQEINGNWTYYTYMYDEAGRIVQATGMTKNVTTTYNIEYACQ